MEEAYSLGYNMLVAYLKCSAAVGVGCIAAYYLKRLAWEHTPEENESDYVKCIILTTGWPIMFPLMTITLLDEHINGSTWSISVTRRT